MLPLYRVHVLSDACAGNPSRHLRAVALQPRPQGPADPDRHVVQPAVRVCA